MVPYSATSWEEGNVHSFLVDVWCHIVQRQAYGAMYGSAMYGAIYGSAVRETPS
jgi:hypothetical protein